MLSEIKEKNMVEKMYRKISKYVSWKSIILCSTAFAVLLIIINGKPFGVAEMKEYTNGVGILDLEKYYFPQYAYEILEAQGEIGRNFYKNLLIRLDFLLPLSYSLCWMSILIMLFRKWLPIESKWQKLSLLPILAGLFDYIENIFILKMLIDYPARHFKLAAIANIMTVLKELFTALSLIMILIALIGLIYKKVSSKKMKTGE